MSLQTPDRFLPRMDGSNKEVRAMRTALGQSQPVTFDFAGPLLGFLSTPYYRVVNSRVPAKDCQESSHFFQTKRASALPGCNSLHAALCHQNDLNSLSRLDFRRSRFITSWPPN